MMRGGFSALARSAANSTTEPAATANFMRFFTPCTVKSSQQKSPEKPSVESEEKKPTGSREAFVKTPSLQKETKTKDLFTAKQRDTKPEPSSSSSSDAAAAQAK